MNSPKQKSSFGRKSPGVSVILLGVGCLISAPAAFYLGFPMLGLLNVVVAVLAAVEWFRKRHTEQ